MNSLKTSHRLLACLTLLCLLVARGGAAYAVEGDITQGNVRPIPIAVVPFETAGGASGQLAQEVSSVVVSNLERSGLFKPIDSAAFIERGASVDRAPRFQDWRVINAEALVVGRVAQSADGRIRAEFRLWDVISGKQLAGEQFFVPGANTRRAGHIVSDSVYERLTGEKGYFDTRIVFVEESGPKQSRVKNLAIMDQDGQNVRPLTRGQNLVLTPRFSPSTQEITYMAYNKAGQPRVVLRDLETGQEEVVLANLPGMTFAPRFAPDGRGIVLSRSEGGTSNIYYMDLRSRQQQQLTNTAAIDTAPCFSPDGRQIVFESDRGGSQQLYVMNRDGSDQRRISFGDGNYSTPVWSPRGDYIAFTKQARGRFLIGVMKPDGSGERILTEGYHNEGPTWAPNGRVLMFFRDLPNEGGPRLFTVDITGYNERIVEIQAYASDPAWSPGIN